MKIRLIALSITASCAVSAQSLSDAYFGPGNWEPDTPSAGESPLYTTLNGDGSDAGSYSGRISVSASDFKDYNLIFAGWKNAENYIDLIVKWGQTTDDYTIGALTFTGFKDSNWKRFEKFGDDQITINVLHDITFKDNYSDNNGNRDYNTNIWLAGIGIAEYNVGGNVEISNSQAIFGSFQKDWSNLRKLNISGDVKMSGDYAAWYTPLLSDTMGTFENPNVKVSGAVDMGATTSRWYYSRSENYNDWGSQTYISIGGLNGSGVVASQGFTSTAKTVIAFNVAEGKTYEYKGVINGESESYTSLNTAAELNLEIRNAATGTQILRMQKNGDAFFTGNIAVYSGTLLYGNQLDMLRSDRSGLTLNGGSFGATNADDNDYYKEAYFSTVTWNGGNIIVDIISVDSQSQSVSWTSVVDTKSLMFGTADSYMFIFNYDDSAIADLDGYELIFSDFLKIANEITEQEFAKLSGKTADGKYMAVGHWNGDYNDAYFKFEAVIPEPAAIAVIFGAIALAFAAYRKRK